ncbi:PREDICTED: nudix hydrolase 18, mitochondrial-like [Ipomoea nil]|uniref:nudix hydrolase 18, mitochondrial-like n=1 Tax=Ipomoea nil TaxID=35883 RepID=UPI0009011862|nr:PREDICTED: nudix hydrolase 18, mitochondrial-like [Ipomoea nil]
MQLKKVASMSSRTGRDLQRYNVEGCRQVVGCIPYRYTKTNQSICGTATIHDLEFLLVSSQTCPRMMFPKGGWEQDESLEEAAHRETFEEAGVHGKVGVCLGSWYFKSKSQGTFHEGFMLPLFVTEELDHWPEKDMRQRSWMSYKEAMNVCFHPWMKEALDCLVSQLNLSRRDENEPRNGMAADETLRSEEQVDRDLAQSVQTKDGALTVEEPRMILAAQSLIDGSPGTAYLLELLITEGQTIALSLQRNFVDRVMAILVTDETLLSIVAQKFNRKEEKTSDKVSDRVLEGRGSQTRYYSSIL